MRDTKGHVHISAIKGVETGPRPINFEPMLEQNVLKPAKGEKRRRFKAMAGT
jgi:hypothetical protein